jgi:hypothetical protein
VVLSDLLFVTSSNAGGHIAHLGGALAGLCFVAGLNKGIDITGWINKLLNLISLPFTKTSWQRKRKPSMKVHYNTDKMKDYEYNANKKKHSDQVDAILDKLKQSGYESLSTEEKQALFDASTR